ncbi:MAG: cupredoxin domain-containing protein [Candidatus Zixiibacteriota bacterium]
MKLNRELRIPKMAVLLLVGVGLVLSLSFCDGGSSGGYGGPGPGPTREFVSPDLSPAESFTHVFNTAKSVPYYCRYHRAMGMTGVITVGAAGTPNKFNLPINSNIDLPDQTIEAGDTITWTNNTGLVHTVESDN